MWSRRPLTTTNLSSSSSRYSIPYQANMRPRLDDGCTCARTCCFDALRLGNSTFPLGVWMYESSIGSRDYCNNWIGKGKEKGNKSFPPSRGYKTLHILSSFSVDQEDSDQEYSCRESTPSSESTEGIIERPNAKRKDYLVSTNGSDVIDLTSLDHKWILKSGYDLSTTFLTGLIRTT